MGITANTKFRLLKGEGTAYMDMTISKKTSIISISKRDMENLGVIIHELSEIEINYVLLTKFITMPYRFVDLTKKLVSTLESVHSVSLGDFISVAHLASPYGWNCLIGLEENDNLEW